MSNQNIVKQLKENAKNKNMLKATQTWLNVWQTWAKKRKVNPKMEEYEHKQLDEMLQILYTAIRTKDGSEYEPESLKSMLAALDRYLKEHGYKYSIIRNREFQQSKLVLERKVRCFRKQGKGKRPNAPNTLTTEEEEMLWSEQSLGDCSPRILSQTMWWILTQHFGLRGRQEHHSMEVEDFSFCVDNSGIEYITFKENPTKTRQGGLNTKHRSVLTKIFATGSQRCPVELLKQYLSKCPQELREKGPFYLAIIENPKTNVWYKKQRLGVNSIDNMMEKRKKRLTNHSARKTVVKKHRAASVKRQSIIQVTGHANEKSLNDYNEGSEKEQHQLSNIISMPPQSPASSSFSGVPAMWSFPASTSACEQVNTSSHAFTVNNFHNCQVTFNVIQGQCSSPKAVNPNVIH